MAEETKVAESRVLSDVSVLESPRHSCALGGAYVSVLAIKDVAPLLHAGPGCGNANSFGLVAGSGGAFLGDLGAMQTPCSYLLEKNVVFGGEEKLADLLDSTEKLMTSKLLVVIPGCIPNMIGDDIPQVVSNYNKTHEVPAIYLKTSGFIGDSYLGYELFLEGVIDQYLTEKPKKVKKGKVNLLGIVPCQHIFWKGDLKEIKRTLELIGLEVNPIFGDLQGVDALKAIPEAELNIVVNPWVGIETAKKLEEKFGTPYVVQEGLPIGPRETEKFVRLVAKKLRIPDNKVKNAIDESVKEAYQLFNFIGVGLYMGISDSYFSIAAESSIAIGLVKFLTNDCGQLPAVVIVTDNPPESRREAITKQLTEGLSSIDKPDVFFECDTYKIEKILDKYPSLLVYASSMEKYIAQEKYAAMPITVSFPAYDRIILTRTYFGFKGGINLLEDLMSKAARPF